MAGNTCGWTSTSLLPGSVNLTTSSKFVTSPPSWPVNPKAARRQETYLAALITYRPQIEIVRGKFKAKTFRCSFCGCRYRCACDPPRDFRTYEEKLTDVALGVTMVKDTAQGYGDLSVLITIDTDLTPAITESGTFWGR
jgi:hypothetical protein